jgi:uncharacterized protein
MRILVLVAFLLVTAACGQAPPPSSTTQPTAPATTSAPQAEAAPTTVIALPGVSGPPYPEPSALSTEAPQPQSAEPAPASTATPTDAPESARAGTSATAAQPSAQPEPTATPVAVIALPGVSGGPAASDVEATVVPDAEITATAGGEALRLLVVADPEKRARGLMFYRSLPDDLGMLFVFPSDAPLSFWMRNTYIPLSVAYLDSERRILNIADMQPLDEQTLHRSAGPARYALEVNQGWFAARNIAPGAVVEFTLPPDLVVR